MHKTYAFFDFDGTISDKDSFFLFLQYVDIVKLGQTCILNLPQIWLYLLGKYPNARLKEKFLKRIIAGKSVTDLKQLTEEFSKNKIPRIIRPGFWERVKFHQTHEHHVVIVTATPRLILQPWCESLGFDILGTELQTDQHDSISGKIDGLNCMGEEKVRRIRSNYQISPGTTIYAYGDSASDLPMMELALPEHRYFKPFR